MDHSKFPSQPFAAKLISAALAVAIGPAAFAQETAPVEENLASTTADRMPIDCDAEFAALDTDGNGYLSEAEAQRAYARSRIDGVTLQEQGISKEEYMTLCGAPAWAENTPEEGAPFEGANSFTEEQARDRAISWNVAEVSAMTLDDQGIWRGTGMLDGANVAVAVDYKGNVVTSAP